MIKTVGKRALGVIPFAIVATLFLLIYSTTTSPLFPHLYGYDSAFFILVGKGMKDGMLPYVDFYDMKGPYLFFLQYLGQLICDGRTGAFIIQVVNLTAALILSDLCHKEIVAKDSKLYWVSRVINVLAVWGFLGLFDGGNMPEEFALPYLYFMLLLALRYIKLYERGIYQCPLHYGFLAGAAFMVNALMSLANSSFLCGCLLAMIVVLVIKREFLNLAKNAGTFVLGMLAVFIPFAVAYGVRGALGEMLHCTFVYGMQYAQSSATPAYNDLVWLLGIVPLGLLLARKKNLSWIVLGICVIVSQLVRFKVGRGFYHYYILLTPAISLGCCLIMSPLQTVQSVKQKVLDVAIRVVAVVLCVSLFPAPIKSFLTVSRNCVRAIEHNDSEKDYLAAIYVRDKIPEDKRDSVYGLGLVSRWYTMTGVYPCNRYCDWQDTLIGADANIKMEIDDFMTNNPPEYVVVCNNYRIDFILAYLEKDYTLVYGEERYQLYELNKP